LIASHKSVATKLRIAKPSLAESHIVIERTISPDAHASTAISEDAVSQSNPIRTRTATIQTTVAGVMAIDEDAAFPISVTPAPQSAPATLRGS
jgi:hypothetical protein